MRNLISFAIIAASLMLTACSQYKYETVDGDPTKTRIYTLDNGLKVYLSVNDKQPRIQTFIAVNVGGKNDPAETTGLAHYFEHLMFKGTEQFGTSNYQAEKPMLDEIERLFEVYRTTDDSCRRAELYRQIDSISYEASKLAIPNEYDKLMSIIGASGTNAFTSQDITAYVEDIPSNQIENWAKIQADRFQHPVIRLFHTELETIYEEKNMSLTKDDRKVLEALDAALFPHHPYGTQTVLGSQEHLKNPSITNVKNYHRTYYVPNNMAICMSGDFNPNEAIRAIDKYFGDMKPNPELPKLQYEKEQPITSPIVKDVYGLEAENITLAWRLPAATDKSNDIAQMADYILNNGTAGLFDLDLLQGQRLLSCYSYANLQPDYGSFVMNGRPKDGQTLDEVRELLLAEVAKLRNGEFDDDLIEATVNNLKLQEMNLIEDNYSRAYMQVNAFNNGEDWADVVGRLDRMAKITKEDIMAWANTYLADNNYVAVYKRIGEDKGIQKIAAPKITPIETNRNAQSDFLVEMQQTPIRGIEPVFVDYKKDLSQLKAKAETNVLYKHNDVNDLATVVFTYDKGAIADPALPYAAGYLGYLGTEEKTAEELAMEMYKLACSYSISVEAEETSISIFGLGENIGKAIDVVEDFIRNAVPDEAILANYKDNAVQARKNSKLSQGACFGRLQNYTMIGKEMIDHITLDNGELAALTSSSLLGKLRGLMECEHEILYYGPADKDELLATIDAHHYIADEPAPLEKEYLTYRQPGERSKVFLTDYDANQLYYLQYSNRGEKFDLAADPAITMYDEYFGGGMNAIVFQEMREARALAYSAFALLTTPADLSQPYTYYAYIATQNDKMQQAIEAFDDIINNMPLSQQAFDIAKQAIITRLKTERVTGSGVLWDYRQARDLGLDEPRDKQLYEKLQDMTLDDVAATQSRWVKDRRYDYAILGRTDELDTDYLKTLGDVEEVTLEEIFGY